MYTKLSIVSAALIGIIFGAVSNYAAILQGSWINLIIWAVIGILIGLFIIDRRYVRWAGISYGFFLTASFLITGFHGNYGEIFSFTLLSIVLSVIGALCGWCLVFVGNSVKSLRS